MIIKITNSSLPTKYIGYISTEKNILYVQYLIMYIKLEFFKYFPDYSLTPQQIVMILNEAYGFKKAEAAADEDVILDTFELWERYCMAAAVIERINIFKNDRLEHFLKKCFLEIINTTL